MKNISRTAAAAVCAIALMGCGESAPSDKDVQAAMARQMDQLMGKGSSESQRDQFAQMKVGKCVRAELGGFSCEVNVAGGGRTTARFKKEKGEWMLAGTGG
jgi:outer membrane lipoprotein SlyB